MRLFIGIDIGTSACRACAIDERTTVVAEARTDLPAPARDGARVEQDAGVWWRVLTETLDSLCQRLNPSRVSRMAVDATSATLLLCDRQGIPLTPGLMYNDARSTTEAEDILATAPADCAAQGASSSLAKLLHLRETISTPAYLAVHQADWLAGMLTGHGIDRLRLKNKNPDSAQLSPEICRLIEGIQSHAGALLAATSTDRDADLEAGFAAALAERWSRRLPRLGYRSR